MSPKEPAKYYHVVPRFDMAAENGPLALGTIVTDLSTLVPLNGPSNHLPVPPELMYKPVIEEECDLTLEHVNSFNVKGWARVMDCVYEACGESRKKLLSEISCTSIMTTYFDPIPYDKYFKESVEKEDIKNWIREKGRVDLYLVTGLKVAKGLKRKSSAGKALRTGAEIGTAFNVAGMGVKVEAGSQREQVGSYSYCDDIVLAFRVIKYACSYRPRPGELRIRNEGFLQGTMMGGRGSDQLSQIRFERLPIEDEEDDSDQFGGAGSSK